MMPIVSELCTKVKKRLTCQRVLCYIRKCTIVESYTIIVGLMIDKAFFTLPGVLGVALVARRRI